MGGMYCFQLAKEKDMEQILALVCGAGGSAVEGMDYRGAAIARQLYVLRDGEQIAGMALFGEADARWDDGEDAMYIRQMIAKEQDQEAGVYMLSFCDVIARSRKRKYLRVTCAAEDEQRNAYYARQGFAAAGEDASGTVRLYQKDLTHCCCGCHEEGQP